MGQDLSNLSKTAAERRGWDYTFFFVEVCRMLDLECKFDVTGPGEDQAPSAARVLYELRKRLGLPLLETDTPTFQDEGNRALRYKDRADE